MVFSACTCTGKEFARRDKSERLEITRHLTGKKTLNDDFIVSVCASGGKSAEQSLASYIKAEDEDLSKPGWHAQVKHEIVEEVFVNSHLVVDLNQRNFISWLPSLVSGSRPLPRLHSERDARGSG